jgi:thioredoxin-related protein
METVTFLNENVQKHIKQNFVPLKYESGPDAEQFLRFGITATPTYVILDSKGDEIYRMIGFHNADDYIGELDSARSIAEKS